MMTKHIMTSEPMSNEETKELLEKDIYEPIREYLTKSFTQKFGNCFLEITAEGVFSSTLKTVVRHDIVFYFLRKKAPDLVGFIARKQSEWDASFVPGIVQDYITVEIKRNKITLEDIYQAKMYGDLFQAKYALLISPERIPEEIKRLDQNTYVTRRYMSGWCVHVGKWISAANAIEQNWLPCPPF